MTELEKMQVALFMVIRNSKVLPVGIAKGKSLQEINKMSYETIQECIKMIDFDLAMKSYQVVQKIRITQRSMKNKCVKKRVKTKLCLIIKKNITG